MRESSAGSEGWEIELVIPEDDVLVSGVKLTLSLPG